MGKFKKFSLGIIGSCVAFLFLLGLSGVAYFFSLRYDVPFRLQGHYEKALYLVDRPFALSPDGTLIAYSSRATGKGDLYGMDSDGKNIRQLTSSPDYEGAPCFSSNGHLLVFCRETNQCGHIWRMALNGSVAKQLTFGLDYDTNPLCTPDGKSIWFERISQGNNSTHIQIFAMTDEGKEVNPLDLADSKLINQAAFCVQNNSVYFMRKCVSPSSGYDSIWQMRNDYTNMHLLALGRYPTVSQDGAQVAFVSGPQYNEIWLMSSDGSHQHKVYWSRGNKHYVVFSSNGHYLYFLEEMPYGSCIARVALNGSDYRHIIETKEEW